MLSKLLKHEFRATARVMGPMYLITLALSVFANGSIRLMDTSDSQLLNILGGLILFLYGIGIAAVIIITLVLMINRFRTNLLGDEGYVMFTLPASVHAQVWSKTIVSTVWFAATTVVVCLAGVLAVFRVSYVGELLRNLRMILSQLDSYYALNGTAILLEFIALCFVGVAATCLQFYAAMAIGHSFANHKTILSVAVYIGFLVALQFLGLSGLLNFPGFNFDGASAVHAFLGLCMAISAVVGAVFYVITTQVLKRRLNLE